MNLKALRAYAISDTIDGDHKQLDKYSCFWICISCDLGMKRFFEEVASTKNQEMEKLFAPVVLPILRAKAHSFSCNKE